MSAQNALEWYQHTPEEKTTLSAGTLIVYVPCDDDIDDVHEDFSTPTSEYCQIQGFVNADIIFAMQAGTTSTASIPSFSRITKNALSDLVTAYKLLYFTYMGNAFSINSLF